MEGLCELMSDYEVRREFIKSDAPLNVLQFNTQTTTDHLSQSSSYDESELLENLASDAEAFRQSCEHAGLLQLVHIPRGNGWTIHMSHQVFSELLVQFGMDDAMLYFTTHYSFGFHHLKPLRSNLHTFFLGTVMYILIWSFDPDHRMTKGLVLPRVSTHYGSAATVLSGLQKLLARYREYINDTCLLAFVASIQLIHSVDQALLDTRLRTHEIEITTGHGAGKTHPSHLYTQSSVLSVSEILRLSQEVGGILVNIANDTRHLEIISTLLAFLLQPSNRQDHPSNAGGQQHDAAHAYFQAEVPIIQVIVRNAKQTCMLFQERFRTHSNVLFTLLTHNDASTSLELAHASTQLAAAARRDSSAMKTIAVMTMLFLPGTFFSSLFAVPSLQWNATNVVGSRFWIYWVFTIPATMLVFIAWLFLTNWKDLMKIVNGRRDEYKTRTAKNNLQP